jgi:hypothetical protein
MEIFHPSILLSSLSHQKHISLQPADASQEKESAASLVAEDEASQREVKTLTKILYVNTKKILEVVSQCRLQSSQLGYKTASTAGSLFISIITVN